MLEAAIGLAILALLVAAGAAGYAWWVHGQMRSRTRALDEAQDQFEERLDQRLLAIQQEASRSGADLRALAGQLEALSTRARTAPPAAQPTVAPPAGAPTATAGPRVIRTRPATDAAATENAAAEPGLENVLADYRQAAEDLADRGDAFIDRYKPVGVARAQDGEGYRAEPDPRSSFIWALRHRDGWALMPGYRALKDWRSHFAAQREHNGEAYFGEAFRLDGSGGRFDVEPAALRRQGDRFVVVATGVISGFRS